MLISSLRSVPEAYADDDSYLFWGVGMLYVSDFGIAGHQAGFQLLPGFFALTVTSSLALHAGVLSSIISRNFACVSCSCREQTHI